MWSKIPAPVASLLPTVVLVLCVLAFLRYAPDSMKPWHKDQGPVVVAKTPDKVVERVKTIVVPGPEKIVYLDKHSLSATLKMPELNLYPGNPTAVTEVAPHVGKTTVVSVLDNAGKTSMVTRQEPTPFWSIKKDMRLEARWLFTGTNLAEAEVVVNPLRVGPVEFEAGVGVEVRRNDSQLGLRSYVGAVYSF